MFAVQVQPSWVNQSDAVGAAQHESGTAEILVSFFKAQDSICISVKDKGQGFSDFDKKFLFQKFKKLSARPTAGESSNGLGLAIVKTLVDRLNGTVELVSEKGNGSEFIVKIPDAKNSS